MPIASVRRAILSAMFEREKHPRLPDKRPDKREAAGGRTGYGATSVDSYLQCRGLERGPENRASSSRKIMKVSVEEPY
jgi:hypothetical protein